MNLDRRIRLPLQTGDDAVAVARRAANAIVPGALLILLGVSSLVSNPFADGTLLQGSHEDPIMRAVYLILLPIGLGSLLIGLGSRSLRRRETLEPTDVELHPDGAKLELAGGPRNLSAAETRGSRLEVETKYEMRATRTLVKSNTAVVRLYLVESDATHTLLATTENFREFQSFEAVAEAWNAAARPAGGDPREASKPHPTVDAPSQVDVLSCDRCGSPIAPTVSDHARCGHCGFSQLMPAELKARAQAARQVQRGYASAEAAVQRLTRQPTAAAARKKIRSVGFAMLCAWPLAAVALVANWSGWAWYATLAWLVLPWLAVRGLHGLLVPTLANRSALRLVCLHAGAHAPRRPGEPPGCRSCGAPLSQEGHGMVVICAFCEAPNVTALDLRPHSARAFDQQLSLVELLLQRREREKQGSWLFWSSCVGMSVCAVVIAL